MSVEHDMGGTMGAPKTIRFFVPYWINNDCSFPLAYRVVEIEPPSECADAKSAKTATRYPSSPGRNFQILEAIEDTSPIPSMLSPQEYVGRGGVNLFSSRNDNYLSPRVGIAVAVRNSDNYSPGVSLLELERKVILIDISFCPVILHQFPGFDFDFYFLLSLPATGGYESFYFRWILLQAFSSTKHDV